MFCVYRATITPNIGSNYPRAWAKYFRGRVGVTRLLNLSTIFEVSWVTRICLFIEVYTSGKNMPQSQKSGVTNNGACYFQVGGCLCQQFVLNKEISSIFREDRLWPKDQLIKLYYDWSEALSGCQNIFKTVGHWRSVSLVSCEDMNWVNH